MNFNIIPTERLLLREMTPETYRHVFDNYNDVQLMQFFGLKTEADLEKKKSDHKNGLTMFNRSFCYFQLLNKETEAFIGWCGYHTWYTQHSRAEIGYGLTEESEKGKGLMKEALLPILRYGFDKMNLHRIEAFIGPENIPSLKLVKAFGFIHEGVMREHYYKNGIAEDSVIFSLLKTEFK